MTEVSWRVGRGLSRRRRQRRRDTVCAIGARAPHGCKISLRLFACGGPFTAEAQRRREGRRGFKNKIWRERRGSRDTVCAVAARAPHACKHEISLKLTMRDTLLRLCGERTPTTCPTPYRREGTRAATAQTVSLLPLRSLHIFLFFKISAPPSASLRLCGERTPITCPTPYRREGTRAATAQTVSLLPLRSLHILFLKSLRPSLRLCASAVKGPPSHAQLLTLRQRSVSASEVKGPPPHA